MNQYKRPEWMVNCEFLERTPAGGDAYFDKDDDRAIIVYRRRVKVYSNRKKGMHGNHACAFSDCEVIDSEQTFN